MIWACEQVRLAGLKTGDETMTNKGPVDTTRRGELWVCYRTNATHAIEMFDAKTLDECREWARCAGFDGIVIGSPSRPWGN